MIILKIIGWLALIAGNVYLDYWLIEKRKTGVNHVLETIFRGGAGILYGGIVFQAESNTGVWIILFEVFSFVTIFEPWLNIKRGLTWDYLSSAPDAARWDRFFINRRPFYYTVKLVALSAFVYSTYKMFVIYG